MPADFDKGLLQKILDIYHEMDQETAVFQLATGIRCFPGCGFCCENTRVEATVLECLPLAKEVYCRGEEERISLAIHEKTELGNFTCTLYKPDTGIPGNGRCSYYKVRPLVCRLFGFARRRNKFGILEFCPCRFMKERSPEIVNRAGVGISHRHDVPVYQDCFMRVASLHPGIGYRLLPLNLAFRGALEHLYWERPRSLTYTKASQPPLLPLR